MILLNDFGIDKLLKINDMYNFLKINMSFI